MTVSQWVHADELLTWILIYSYDVNWCTPYSGRLGSADGLCKFRAHTRMCTYWLLDGFTCSSVCKYQWASLTVIYPFLLISIYSEPSSSMGFFDCIFFRTWSMCPFAVATQLGIYIVTSYTVITWHDWKYPLWISLIHVDFKGPKVAACRYLTNYVWLLTWYALLILWSASLSSYG